MNKFCRHLTPPYVLACPAVSLKYVTMKPIIARRDTQPCVSTVSLGSFTLLNNGMCSAQKSAFWKNPRHLKYRGLLTLHVIFNRLASANKVAIAIT